MTSAVRQRAYSPAARATMPADPSRVLVIACGALARELVAVIDQAGLADVDLTCLPATLHNRPGGIPAAVRAKIRAARPRYRQVFIAYADCGTGGLLDRVLADEGVERLPGAHCYEVYSGAAAFGAMTDEDPATFFLTDFLARNFDRLVIRGLGLDRHPELLPTYFGNYNRLVYLVQADDPALVVAARRAASRLGLTFELRRTGYGELATSLLRAADAEAARASDQVGLAPGASNVAPAPALGTETVESLQPGQGIRTPSDPGGPVLRSLQESGPVRSARRRSLRPTQPGAGFLRRAQGSSAASGTAPRSPSAATARSA